MKTESFDAIILDTTFLCWRWGKPPAIFHRLLEDYEFVARSDAVKIALPQDEYDHSELLDEWLAAWRVDVIYSVCHEHRAIFYPRASVHAKIKEGLTGFVDDADIEFAAHNARPFAERGIDVGYRARLLSPQFGRFGMMKAEIGARFRDRMAGTPLRLDISLRTEDVFVGDAWLRFLGDCRFTLGCESGSSLLDPTGTIGEGITRHLAKKPDATFEEVEAACFPGLDYQHVFSAISPRLFESTLSRSCNVLVPGRYLGVLEPGKHYIAIESDLSNIDDVYAEMCDLRSVQDKIEACYEALIASGRFRYQTFKDDLLEEIAAGRTARQRRISEKSAASLSVAHVPGDVGEASLRHLFLLQILGVAESAGRDLKSAIAGLPVTTEASIAAARLTKKIPIAGNATRFAFTPRRAMKAASALREDAGLRQATLLLVGLRWTRVPRGLRNGIFMIAARLADLRLKARDAADGGPFLIVPRLAGESVRLERVPAWRSPEVLLPPGRSRASREDVMAAFRDRQVQWIEVVTYEQSPPVPPRESDPINLLPFAAALSEVPEFAAYLILGTDG